MNWNKEPVAIAAAVRAVLYAAILLGLDLTNEQMLAIVAAVESVTALFVRSRVVPVKPVIWEATRPDDDVSLEVESAPNREHDC